MIRIGQVNGGPELRDGPIDRAIAKIYRLRGSAGEGDHGFLDVVFHVAGSLLEPEFDGVRTGRFSRRRRMLQVQIAVPKEVVAAEDPYPILAASSRRTGLKAQALTELSERQINAIARNYYLSAAQYILRDLPAH
jgi:hypothetical protein